MFDISQSSDVVIPVAKSVTPRNLSAGSLYTSADLMHLTKMTRKQITYWAKIGLIRPSLIDSRAGTGQPSLFYSRDEVIRAFVATELRAAGFTPRQLKRVLMNLESIDFDWSGSRAYILTDGHSVYAAYDEGEVVDVLKNHRQMLLLVPVHEQVAKLEGAA